jgi:hypothetical protein
MIVIEAGEWKGSSGCVRCKMLQPEIRNYVIWSNAAITTKPAVVLRSRVTMMRLSFSNTEDIARNRYSRTFS